MSTRTDFATRGAPSVVHVVSDAGPHQQFRTLFESGAFDRTGMSVGCVGPSGALQEDMASLGVSTFAMGARTRRDYPLAVLRLSALLRRQRADIVHTHLLDGSLVGLTAARLARTPVAVVTAHHSHEVPFHGKRLMWAERLCTGPLCNHIIAPSKQVADTLTQVARVPTRKIEVVHHGIDLQRFDPDTVDRAAARRALGLADELVFGAVGRIYRLKNYPALLQGFASALRAVPEARLLVVGAGDPSSLHSLAGELGISDRVLVSPPRSDVRELLAAFDVFVHPAIAESFGLVILEAMAMARPVLTTPVGIAPEVIVPGMNGILCSSPSAEALAQGLRDTIAVRARWGEIGAAARERVRSFTAASMANRYEELYARWTNERSANRR